MIDIPTLLAYTQFIPINGHRVIAPSVQSLIAVPLQTQEKVEPHPYADRIVPQLPNEIQSQIDMLRVKYPDVFKSKIKQSNMYHFTPNDIRNNPILNGILYGCMIRILGNDDTTVSKISVRVGSGKLKYVHSIYSIGGVPTNGTREKFSDGLYHASFAYLDPEVRSRGVVEHLYIEGAISATVRGGQVEYDLYLTGYNGVNPTDFNRVYRFVAPRKSAFLCNKPSLHNNEKQFTNNFL